MWADRLRVCAETASLPLPHFRRQKRRAATAASSSASADDVGNVTAYDRQLAQCWEDGPDAPAAECAGGPAPPGSPHSERRAASRSASAGGSDAAAICAAVPDGGGGSRAVGCGLFRQPLTKQQVMRAMDPSEGVLALRRALAVNQGGAALGSAPPRRVRPSAREERALGEPEARRQLAALEAARRGRLREAHRSAVRRLRERTSSDLASRGWAQDLRRASCGQARAAGPRRTASLSPAESPVTRCRELLVRALRSSS
eukprot:TRINITY_DN45010_c0_g1_i2.p1 TRINITY_DN45010_c0_g1~~TRINITY_DN45010_c0_g1_i2.p1  ORF type:complete len:298 (+),score=63.55 TRINITY_DN45010_c0_g1_i2:122-895(+)